MVLLVEDDAADREVYSRALATDGFHVIQARDGVEALDELAKTFPACIVADWKMPRMGGRELITLLKRSELFRSIPVVLLSGLTHDEAEALHEGALVGVEGFFTKPVAGHLLALQVRRLIDRYSREETEDV